MIEAPRIEHPRRVLVVGGHTREHLMALGIRSPEVEVFVAPGNAGTEKFATNLPTDATDINKIVKDVLANNIEFVAVGPERPLVMGLADAIEEEAGIQVFGHKQDRMFLEASKAEGVRKARLWNIPIPDYRIFSDYEEAENFIKNSPWGKLVIKADGLTEGKGVVLPDTFEEAVDALRKMMIERKYKEAGDTVVIQERLYGVEASVIGFVSNEVGLLVPAKDYKTLYDGDVGPNTGGMGAYAPNEVITPQLLREIKEKIIEPTRMGMISEGKPLTGLMYFGLMITDDGPKLLEWNQRLGEPDSAPQLILAKFNLLKAMQDTRNETLSSKDIVSSSNSAVGVYVASEGYPEKPIIDREIFGLEEAGREAIILHAGTRRDGTRTFTKGGRVALSVGTGPTLRAARGMAYRGANAIKFQGKQQRSDIAAEEELSA